MQDVLAVEAVDMMSSRFKQPITSLLVTDKKGALVGLIRLQECIKAGIV
jgi:hypothetical protein